MAQDNQDSEEPRELHEARMAARAAVEFFREANIASLGVDYAFQLTTIYLTHVYLHTKEQQDAGS